MQVIHWADHTSSLQRYILCRLATWTQITSTGAGQEDMEAAGVPRPAYVINATHPGTDMAASGAAALAAVSMVTS